jgi:hypothetical protein
MKTIKTIKKSLQVMVIVLYGALLHAQVSSGEIKGKVFDDADKQPLPGVTVWVDQMGKKINGVSDINGKFTIKPLDPGTYIINYSFINKQKVTQTIEVKPNMIAFAKDVYLGDSTLPEVTINGNKLIDAEQTSLTYIPAKELKNNPNIRNIGKMIGTYQSDIKVSEDGKDAYVRGARADAIIYFVDGVKITGTVPKLPGAAINSMSIYTGGVPAKYGDMMGGVIAIETKSYFQLYNEWVSKTGGNQTRSNENTNNQTEYEEINTQEKEVKTESTQEENNK